MSKSGCEGVLGRRGTNVSIYRCCETSVKDVVVVVTVGREGENGGSVDD